MVAGSTMSASASALDSDSVTAPRDGAWSTWISSSTGSSSSSPVPESSYSASESSTSASASSSSSSSGSDLSSPAIYARVSAYLVIAKARSCLLEMSAGSLSHALSYVNQFLV